MNRIRPGLTRGVPYLAPVIETLKQLDKYSEAEIMSAVVSAMFTVFVKSESEDGLAPFGGQTDSTNDNDYKLGVGAILDLQPNESIEIADPKRPNQAFDPFVQAVCVRLALRWNCLLNPNQTLYRQLFRSTGGIGGSLEVLFCTTAMAGNPILQAGL